MQIKHCSKCNEDKNISLFSLDKNRKDGHQATCKTCRAFYRKNNKVLIAIGNKKWVSENKEKVKAINTKYKKFNEEKIKQSKKIYRLKTYEKRKLAKAMWDLKNQEKVKDYTIKWRNLNLEKAKSNVRLFAKNNPWHANYRNAKRRALKMFATPSWANNFFISEIYNLAKLRNSNGQIKWHVDHIIPLKNKYVCGLHVENNLQIIPAILNMRKHNTFDLEGVIETQAQLINDGLITVKGQA